MEDMNIIVRNGMGVSSNAKSRLSAKSSIQRKKNTMLSAKNIKRSIEQINKGQGAIASGSGAASLTGLLSKTSLATAATAGLVIKATSTYINYKEAVTGEQVRAHNARNTLQMISSLGTKYVMKSINNEIFTKKTISRQNYGLEYGREIYGINVEGTKYKGFR